MKVKDQVILSQLIVSKKSLTLINKKQKTQRILSSKTDS